MRERRGGLDGIRAVALIAVLLYHAAPGVLPGGFLGVEVFFVLSGYLLTSILLAHHRADGVVGWRRYASRRIRRLAPALLALLATLVIVVPFVARDDAHRLAGDLYSSLVGITNWHLIQDHSSYFSAVGRPPFVRHLWSLAVEIQFYVLCPLLVTWLARRSKRRAALALLGAIGASALVMALLFSAHDPSRAYYGTDARIGAMLSGTLLALLLAGRELRPTPWFGLAGGLSTVALVLLFSNATEQARAMYPAGFLATQLATALLIVAVERGSRAAAPFTAASLRWLGERSYGIYLWHWPLVALLRPRIDVTWPSAVAALITIGGAIVLGHCSYVLLERPFMLPLPARGRRLVWLESAVALVAAAGLATLVIDLPHTDPIVSSLREGQRVVSLQRVVETTTTVAPTTTTAPPAPAAAPAPPPPPPPPPVLPPPGTYQVAAIGDSVMLGAAPQLQARLGNTGFIDAKVGRQYAEGVATVRQLRAQGRLGEVVVIHLGTNGPPHKSDVQALMAALEGVKRVVFVSVRMPRSWEGQTNDAVKWGAANYSNVVIADWYAHSNGHPEWFRSDGVHTRPVGALAFADLIASALAPAPSG